MTELLKQNWRTIYVIKSAERLRSTGRVPPIRRYSAFKFSFRLRIRSHPPLPPPPRDHYCVDRSLLSPRSSSIGGVLLLVQRRTDDDDVTRSPFPPPPRLSRTTITFFRGSSGTDVRRPGFPPKISGLYRRPSRRRAVTFACNGTNPELFFGGGGEPVLPHMVSRV